MLSLYVSLISVPLPSLTVDEYSSKMFLIVVFIIILVAEIKGSHLLTCKVLKIEATTQLSFKIVLLHVFRSLKVFESQPIVLNKHIAFLLSAIEVISSILDCTDLSQLSFLIFFQMKTVGFGRWFSVNSHVSTTRSSQIQIASLYFSFILP